MLAINIQQLRFAYGSAAVPTLAIADWQVPAGRRTFLHGRSGSGKTTLLRLLSGQMLPQSGTLEVLGQNMASLSASARDRFRAANIGLIAQQLHLLPYLSVADNIRLAAHLAGKQTSDTDQQIRQLLQRLDMPDQLFEQMASHLSLGQQQRVAIARALINRPALILADEPTSALDEESATAFMQLLLDSLDDHTSLVLISHDRRLARHFDQDVAISDLTRKEP
ncbi:ABC transporter ATP-binding protein [Parathalassolituus penaei]|uniref:ABC transporter ATP-binding protein n=1 Tax=Parathalassolituus penaei TaxID=2997323 RepID=A0A9X3EEL2_9GAMM|nr:ABC transporter ATP-binding protein [Parathalassolituus penaei]MCY0966183.1 ABC transporter ATP-binding protein [Parathalassolituus penaei]